MSTRPAATTVTPAPRRSRPGLETGLLASQDDPISINASGRPLKEGTAMSVVGPSGNTCWPGRAMKAVLIPAHAAPATSHPWAATNRHSDTSTPTRRAAHR